MSKIFDAYNKIDQTCFLNNWEGYLQFGLDTIDHTDCVDLPELVNSLITVREGLFERRVFKKALILLKDKCVDVFRLKTTNSAQEYDKFVEFEEYRLSIEEYEFLKKVMETLDGLL